MRIRRSGPAHGSTANMRHFQRQTSDGAAEAVEPRRNDGGSFQKELPMAETEESCEKTEKRKEDLDRKLDQQLEETFPTSDPPSLSQPTSNKPAGDPKPRGRA